MSKQRNSFWQVVKAKANKAELLIYGEISSFSFWGDEVTPKEVNEMLNAIGDNVADISVRINSPGGDVFAGMAIHSMLKRHPAKITAYVDGLAASIASVIPLAADKIVMPKGSMYMIHRPMGSARLMRSEGLRQRADLLDKIETEMTDLYSGKSGMSAEAIKPLLEAETWYTADEAKAAGFIDEIEGELEMAACLRDDTAIINGLEMNWKQFRNAPSLPKVESPAAVDYTFKAAARERQLQLISREV
ncbi:head maturation protease, ClpP-related [Paenibacillus ginsengarvi]|uniref:ATP-dependent Clp protease proteolytic subunit n=1 Tax=Paenibacillus ginsengarvi TaxID=400777 RepID=A0A3B0CR37_9BACL|nr:head maturation protease, ClpP-related [Paenibacillus ginsengarvi]RKN86750.1 Clp protease ClpP [Paenibacillus ginsengarvi]